MRNRFLLATAGLLVLPKVVDAARPTQVLTAVEPDRPLPELHLSATYERSSRSGDIVREWIQGRTTPEATALDVRELDYTENIQRLILELRVGLYHDLEFHMIAPVILQSESEVKFADGVAGRSTIFGSPNADANCGASPCEAGEFRYPVTSIPAERERSGFGDMTFGLSWSPLVQAKDESFPTMTLRGDIVVPTGKVRTPDDPASLPGQNGGGVGLGQTTFDLSLALSKRLRTDAPTFEPYFLLGARIHVPTPKQKDLGYEPAPSGRFVVGTEVLVYEHEATAQRYGFDLSFGVEYIGIGRTYSELSDYLPNFNQTQVKDANGEFGRDPVGYADYQSAANYNNAREGATCGTTSGIPCGELNRVDEHLQVATALAIHLQPAEYAFFRVGLGLNFTTNHLLTTERVGEDKDPAEAANQVCGGAECVGRVNAKNAQGEDERSPYYDPRYDAPGRRFRIEDAVALIFFVTGEARF